MPGPNLNIDLRGQIAQTSGVQMLGARVITAGPVVVSDSDFTLVVNQTVAGPLSIPLPAATGLSAEPGSVRLRIFDGKGDAASNNITITGTGALIDGAANVVISTNWGGVDLEWRGTYWTVLNRLSGAAAPAAHAATHRQGGADDLLTNPGDIGALSTPVGNLFFSVGQIPGGGGAVAIRGATNFNGIQIDGTSTSGQQSLEMNGEAPAAHYKRRVFIRTMDDGETFDITGLGLGGSGRVVAAHATAATGGIFDFAADGATTTNGQTYTNFDTADTAAKICALASGGALRIKNNLGGQRNVLIVLDQLNAVA